MTSPISFSPTGEVIVMKSGSCSQISSVITIPTATEIWCTGTVTPSTPETIAGDGTKFVGRYTSCRTLAGTTTPETTPDPRTKTVLKRLMLVSGSPVEGAEPCITSS